MNIIFFGSTEDSVNVLNKLFELRVTSYELRVAAIVTQPPRPVGRKHIITPTPVEIWAKDHSIPILSFPSDTHQSSLYENEQTVIDTLAPFKAELLISACYGQKIPTAAIASARYGGLNVHPSLLPRWRGADPVPWAILSGDHQTGVTVVTLSESFDEGNIIAQKKLSITNKDFSLPLRTKLFALGANLLVDSLPSFLASKGEALKGSPRGKSETPYARRLTREDGFEPWENIQKALGDPEEAVRIDRKFRAFMPWPGLWTKVTIQREQQINKLTKEIRLKILTCHLSPESTLVLDTVQLEGKKPLDTNKLNLYGI